MMYTPKEVAQFLRISDFPYSKERKIIHMIYSQEASIYERLVDVELELLVEGRELIKNQEEALWSFFKVIKLRLVYNEECEFVRIKLRTVLKEFGYKRRSDKLMSEIQLILDTLELDTFLKGYVGCELKEIDLDDFMMIRLQNKH